MAAGTLVVRISANITDFARNLDAAEKRLVKAGDKLERLGQDLSLKVTAPLVALSAAFAKSAAEDAASVEKLGRTFGAAQGRMEAFTQSLMKSVPATDDAIRGLLSSTGTLLTSMGTAPQKAAAMSQTVLKLAGDLAAYNHVSLETATDAIDTALAGRTRGLVALNVVVTEADVKAKAYAMGLAKMGSELSASAKAQATLAAILDKSAQQQGEANRKYNDADNALARLKQNADGVADSFGKIVLPTFVKVSDSIGSLLRNLAAMPDSAKSVIVAIGGIAAAAPVLLVVAGNLVKSVTILSSLKVAQSAGAFLSLATQVRSLGAAADLARMSILPLISSLAIPALVIAPIAAVAYLWYKSGEAAREAAKKVDEFRVSLADMNQEQLKTKTLDLQAQFDAITRQITAAKAKLPKAAPLQIGFANAKVGNPAATVASSALHDQIRDLEAQRAGIAQQMFDAGSRFTALSAPGTGGGGGGGGTNPATAIDELTDRAGRLARTYELTNARGSALAGLNTAITDTMQRLSAALGAQTDQWSALALKIRQAREELSKAARAGDATLIQQTQSTGAVGLNLHADNVIRGANMPLAIGKMSEPLVKQVTLQERMVTELAQLPQQFASTIGQYLGPVLARMGGGTGGAIGAALGGGIGGAVGKAVVGNIGALAGKGIGAAIGSAALPVVGTILGSLAGNVIGGTIGKLFGGGGPSPAEKAAEQLNALARAAQKVQEAISGLPEGIKIASYRFDAQDAAPSTTKPGGGTGKTGGSTTGGDQTSDGKAGGSTSGTGTAPGSGSPLPGGKDGGSSKSYNFAPGSIVVHGASDAASLFRMISDFAESQVGRGGTSAFQLAAG